MNFREKIARMMYGRYGVDALSKGILYTSVAFLVLNMFLRNIYVNAASMILLFICYYRMFSRDFTKRQNENMKFMKYCNRVKYHISKLKYRMSENKTHHIYRCPSCKQKIRIPRGRGKSVFAVRSVVQNLLKKANEKLLCRACRMKRLAL